MQQLHNRIVVNATPAQAWAIVGDLSSVTSWIPGLVAVNVDGMQRICTFENGMVQHETISDYSAASYSYNYSIDSGGLPLKTNHGTLRVAVEDGQTVVLWDSELTFIDAKQEAELLPMIGQAYQQTCEKLKQQIEAVSKA